MRETRVNLKHLLEDIRDSYSLSIEEAIIVELVANALDSRAPKIDFFIDPAGGRFTVCDNGQGMKRNVINDYHNIAATTKMRGERNWICGNRSKAILINC